MSANRWLVEATHLNLHIYKQTLSVLRRITHEHILSLDK